VLATPEANEGRANRKSDCTFAPMNSLSLSADNIYPMRWGMQLKSFHEKPESYKHFRLRGLRSQGQDTLINPAKVADRKQQRTDSYIQHSNAE
jgi:hypothetical protein